MGVLMPTVDFTLEDIAKQTQKIVESALVKEREHTTQLLNDKLTQEREYTAQLIVGELAKEREYTAMLFAKEREYTRVMIQDAFASFWEDNLSPVLDEIMLDIKDLKHDMKGLKRLVDQHSKDIMELRAAQ